VQEQHGGAVAMTLVVHAAAAGFDEGHVLYLSWP
jgi:hypothetical protein